ncbi:hypothetical protein ACFVWG_28650 [Kribbella sp. NPDC058245]|uniref:hypothetical protein n=1 Tax=Kribbella sp. NPDC058245 TaxID=3346399 RepID=UPI0036E89C2E
MDQIDAFVNRIPGWLDETGAMAEPDLGLLRDLLVCRAEVLGHTDPWSWPKESLANTVLEVAPYVLQIDEAWRAAAVTTLPVLRDFVVFEGDRDSAASLRRDVEAVLAVLTGALGRHLDDSYGWSLMVRLNQQRKDVADRKAWQAEFDALPWVEQDRLVGPLRRQPVSLGGDPFGGVTVPAPQTVLPSEVGAAAAQAPLVAAVVELAEWLVAQPSIAAGGALDDDSVTRVLAETTFTDAAAVQEAWRIAALSELVGSTGARVVPGPQFAVWSDPGRRVECWYTMARAVVVDVPLPDRDEVLAAIYAAYHPGLNGLAASDLARAAIDRLGRLGMFDGPKLSPLGVQGVLLPWLSWDAPGRWRLTAGPWRPELTTSDVRFWLAASMKRLVSDAAGQSWVQTADPVAFGNQLVNLMLESGDGVERATAFILLTHLGSQVTPVADRLAGTRLQAYRAMWPDASARAEADDAQMLLFLRDQMAWLDLLGAEVAELRPGVQIDLGRFDFVGPWPDWFRERMGRPGPLTDADLAVLRESLTTQRAEFAEMVAQLSDEQLPLHEDGRTS